MFTVKVFTFSPIQENTYVLSNEAGDAIIIDPGCYFPEEKDALASYLQDNALKPVMLLQTHTHLDHVFGTRWVAETYGLQPHLHENEKKVMSWAAQSGLMWNLPFDMYEGPVKELIDGQDIRLREDHLQVYFTPGHSPGHVVFHCAAQQFVIGGDVLFRGSIGRTDLPGGDYDTLITSIETKLMTLPDATKVYSGHGPVTTIGEERATNPFLNTSR